MILTECSPMVQETSVQSQVKSYQRLKKSYLMPPCLTLSIIKVQIKGKWSNPGKGVAPLPLQIGVVLIEKGASGSPSLWLAKWLNSSMWPINGTLTGTTTPGQSEPESNGNEGVLHIPQTLEMEPHHQIV